MKQVVKFSFVLLKVEIKMMTSSVKVFLKND